MIHTHRTRRMPMRTAGIRTAIAASLLFAATASTSACGPRQVEVRTAPTQTSEVAIHFTNNLSKAVNVYVNTGGSDLFVRQVAANTTEHLPVRRVGWNDCDAKSDSRGRFEWI